MSEIAAGQSIATLRREPGTGANVVRTTLICLLLAAAIFALHPLHAESVAWISERKDVLCALFFIATIGCYARYARRASLAWYLITLACLALALMSKPMAVTLPVILLLLDVWPLRRSR